MAINCKPLLLGAVGRSLSVTISITWGRSVRFVEQVSEPCNKVYEPAGARDKYAFCGIRFENAVSEGTET